MCEEKATRTEEQVKELQDKVKEMEMEMESAKEDLRVTLNMIVKVEKKIDTAEQKVKKGRTNMVNTQDKCEQKQKESKQLRSQIAQKEGKQGSFDEELEEKVEEVPKKVEVYEEKKPLSFADILRIRKTAKSEETKKESNVCEVSTKKVEPEIVDIRKMDKVKLKEYISKIKYEIRSVEHKRGQMHDKVKKDSARISVILERSKEEMNKLQKIDSEAEVLC